MICVPRFEYSPDGDGEYDEGDEGDDAQRCGSRGSRHCAVAGTGDSSLDVSHVCSGCGAWMAAADEGEFCPRCVLAARGRRDDMAGAFVLCLILVLIALLAGYNLGLHAAEVRPC